MLLLAISMMAGMDVGNGSRYGYEGDAFDNVGTFACRRTCLLYTSESGVFARWDVVGVTGDLELATLDAAEDAGDLGDCLLTFLL